MNNGEKKDYLIYLMNTFASSNIDDISSEDFNSQIKKITSFLPNKLYKYREFNPRNISLLEGQKIWLSDVTSWPDKSDTTIALKELETKDINGIEFKELRNNIVLEIYKFITWKYGNSDNKLTTEKINSIYEGASVAESFSRGKAFSRLIASYGKVMGLKIDKAAQKMIKEVWKKEYLTESFKKAEDFSENLRKSYKGFCMSENYNVSSQWDNYADGAKGYCIEYSIKKDSYSKDTDELLSHILPIIYDYKEDIHPLELILESLREQIHKSKEKEISTFFVKVFVQMMTKDPSYEPELEWRVLVEKKKYEASLASFPYITAVYIGNQMSKGNKKRLISIARINNWKVYYREFNSFSSNYNYNLISFDPTIEYIVLFDQFNQYGDYRQSTVFYPRNVTLKEFHELVKTKMISLLEQKTKCKVIGFRIISKEKEFRIFQEGHKMIFRDSCLLGSMIAGLDS